MACMRIGLDVTALISGSTGVARYAGELVRHLANHPDVEVRPFAIGRTLYPVPPGARHVPVPLRIVHRSWRTFAAPSARAFVGTTDVVHALDMVPPPGRVPTIATIQDVLPLVLPEEYGERYKRIARQQADAARRVASVVTTCEATADAIVDVLGIERSRITVAPPGHRAPHPDPMPSPPGPYLLAVGALTPRKGFVELAAAVGRLGPGAPPLLVAGPDGTGAEKVHQQIAALGLGDRVRLLGAVSDRELDALFRGAIVACHPSRAEGFGIPALEALSFGVPLIAADIPPVREICAGAALLVPTGDVDALAGAIEHLLADEEARADMVSAGTRRAADFGWDTMTDHIVGLYRSLTC